MKVNELLFTQTMHALLKSSLSLQDALAVCAEISFDKHDKQFCQTILKQINEGRLLSDALKERRDTFSVLYRALVRVGEETGSLAEVFGKLSAYLKTKKEVKQKMMQALAYPVLVLLTALCVTMLIVFFVLPRLHEIFAAFSETSGALELHTVKLKGNLLVAFVVLCVIIVMLSVCFVLYKTSERMAFVLDACILHIPVFGKFITVMQLQDFSFAMRILVLTHFPLVQALSYASNVLANRKMRKSCVAVCERIARGESAGRSFEKESAFPKYISVWVKIAEKNGDAASVFTQISDYYSAESENLTANMSAFAEPALILITGGIVIVLVAQIVIPVFSMLGAL